MPATSTAPDQGQLIDYPGPRTTARALPEVLTLLGINISDDDLDTACTFAGGFPELNSLLEPSPNPRIVAGAWKSYLDVSKAEPQTKAQLTGSLIALLAILEGFSGTKSRRGQLTISLRKYQLGWVGSWRELNIRLAGQLYLHAGRVVQEGDYETAEAVYQEALVAWLVVEALDAKGSTKQRKIWRGMRGATRLWLARRHEEPKQYLVGANDDLAISFESGDQSSQHFTLHGEVAVRLYETDGDQKYLQLGKELLEAAESAGLRNAELDGLRGDLMFARGLRALPRIDVIGDGEIARKDLEESADLLHSLVEVESHHAQNVGATIESDRRADPTALRAAAGAFRAAVIWYTRSLQRTDGSSSSIWTVRRGQAATREAHALRLLSKPKLDRSRRAALELAIRDLASCELPETAIHGPYWPWAILDMVRLNLKDAPDSSLQENADLVARGLIYAAVHLNEADNRRLRLEQLNLELRLRIALQKSDVETIRTNLEEICRDDGIRVPATPMIYAARALISSSEEKPILDADLLLVLAVVGRLESEASRSASSHRRFLASHAMTLLALATSGSSSDIDRSTLKRIYDLACMAADADPALEDPLVLAQRARAAMRYARSFASSDLEDDRVEATDLYSEAINLFEHVITHGDRIWFSLVDHAASPNRSHEKEIAIQNSPQTLVLPSEADMTSLVGESYLRRDTLLRRTRDVDLAIRNFERSRAAGNNSHQLLGLLADAHYRVGRRRSDQAALRQCIELKLEARRRGGPPTREAFSVAASAARVLWRLVGDPKDYLSSVSLACWAANVDPQWPWPALQLAELLTQRDGKGIEVPSRPPVDGDSGIAASTDEWEAVKTRNVDRLFNIGCSKAVDSLEFRRTVLGGRSRAYVLRDPHGLLATTLVLKPMDDLRSAQAEDRNLRGFANYLRTSNVPTWAESVQPLAIVTTDDRPVLASRRSPGRTLTAVISDLLRGPTTERFESTLESVRRALCLLARVHAWRGTPPSGSDGTQIALPTKPLLRDLADLGMAHAASAVRAWERAVPEGLPMVGKRDAHADNWLLTEGGKLVALDLQSSGWLPLGFEVAQLVEDTALLDLASNGSDLRTDLAAAYLSELVSAWPQLVGIPDATSEIWSTAYACFAARRAIFLLRRTSRPRRSDSSSGTRMVEGQTLKHAQRTLVRSVETVPSLEPLLSCLGR